jgi:hypothetical protein
MSQPTPCRSCGAPLAPDQRYCLACGTRVAAPRLDFLAEMERAPAQAAGDAGAATAPAAVAAAATQPAPAATPSRLDRVGGPMGAAAVVLVALGVGFLIGQGGEPAPVAQRAPVVNIQGGLPAGSSAGSGTETPSGGETAGGSGGDAAGDSSTGRRRASNDAEKVQRSTDGISKAAPRASGDITRLRSEPDTTATPGAPPPKDNGESGGGTDALEIG